MHKKNLDDEIQSEDDNIKQATKYEKAKRKDDAQTQYENSKRINRVSRFLVFIFFSWGLIFWILFYLILSLLPNILIMMNCGYEYIFIINDIKNVFEKILIFLLLVMSGKFVKDISNTFINKTSKE